MDPEKHLLIEPRKVVSREEFLQYPSYSIAIDGFVPDAPFTDTNGPRANFNHHENVVRLCTRSTAGQLHVSAKSGLFEELFSRDGKPYAFIYANDCDEDVCLTTWQAFHYERIKGTNSSPLLTRLIGVSDLLDTTSGMYPVNGDYGILEELAWIYEPYKEQKMAGKIASASESDMRKIIFESWSRINQYLEGKGKRLALDTRYDILQQGEDWTIVKEIGSDARLELAKKQKGLYVLLRDVSSNGYTYIIGKLSPFAKVDLLQFYSRINSIEGSQIWSGSDLVGGCGRDKKSQLAPKDLAKVLEEFTKFQRR